MTDDTKYLTPIFGIISCVVEMPKKINDNPAEPQVVAEIIREYLKTEGKTTQNLTTFCQTYMKPSATEQMAENFVKNALPEELIFKVGYLGGEEANLIPIVCRKLKKDAGVDRTL